MKARFCQISKLLASARVGASTLEYIRDKGSGAKRKVSAAALVTFAETSTAQSAPLHPLDAFGIKRVRMEQGTMVTHRLSLKIDRGMSLCAGALTRDAQAALRMRIFSRVEGLFYRQVNR